LLTKREVGGIHAFDDLATGLDTGAISRSKAIKLGGAALVGSALGLFASSRGADAQEAAADVSIAGRRGRCRRKGGDFCSHRGASICCSKGRRRRKACCGKDGAACCSKNERCDQGKCKRHN
jgi:hypothetical protein